VLLALLATACGSGTPPAPDAAPDVAPLDLSGVVLLQRGTWRDDVVFADPATGVVKTTLPLPGHDNSLSRFDGPATKLDLVSPDGRYATLEIDGDVDVFKLNTRDRRYERTGTVPGFRNPRFGPAGTKLYFDNGEAVYSADYTNLGEPAKEADVVPTDDVLDKRVQAWWLDAQGDVLTWKNVHRAGVLAYLTDSAGAIAYAIYDDASTRYYLVTPLDATTALMYARHRHRRARRARAAEARRRCRAAHQARREVRAADRQGGRRTGPDHGALPDRPGPVVRLARHTRRDHAARVEAAAGRRTAAARRLGLISSPRGRS